MPVGPQRDSASGGEDNSSQNTAENRGARGQDPADLGWDPVSSEMLLHSTGLTVTHFTGLSWLSVGSSGCRKVTVLSELSNNASGSNYSRSIRRRRP
jgi:hypothetical protein